jgi:error-prone DNA polymerase
MFTHLNTHSHYSLLRGTASPETLCAAVKAAGMDSVALTDTNGLYGLLLFLEAAKDHGLQSIVGAEVRVNGAPFRGLGESSAPSFPVRDPSRGRAGWTEGWHASGALSSDEACPSLATLLVQSQTGYANLCRILSDYHLQKIPPTPLDKGGNIASSQTGTPLIKGGQGGSDMDGLVILTSDLPLLRALRGHVEHLYAELTPGKGIHELLKAAREMGIPPVATNRVHFLTKADYSLHRLLRAIDLNTTLSRLPESEVEPEGAWLKTPQQMEEYFFFCPEAIENTQRLAELCNWTPQFPMVVPQFEGMTPEQTCARLREEAYKGAAKRYGEITPAIRERLEYELDMIRRMNFASIFLVVQDIVKQSPRTCGRGSAAASIVSYCLEITHVDPLRHNLYFERFLNPGRKDPPDIDVDFAWDERDAVLDYVFRKYGPDHTAMISNHVTFQPRAAIHEAAKVYGLPEAEITAVTKKMSGYWDDGVEDVRHNPALRYHDFDPPWPEILGLASRLHDIPRHLSVHCGGVIITPGPVWDHVPVQRAVKPVNVIHWEKDQAEDAGLVKIDLLGNRSLGVIRDALMMIEANCGPRIEFAKWNPIDDPATQELIARGDTMGVFYIESPATRLLEKKARVGDFEHAVLHSSIIRPAANPYIHLYLERLKGKPYEPLHPLLEDILGETYGIMVYQEDVSKVAMALAGFDSLEANELRKILSKKHKQKRLMDLQRKFVQGALDRGVSKDAIRAIWEMILSFAGYSFCKPHSASFALVSFKSAWLRAHYPAEFMAAVISNQGGYYSTFAYISESRRIGLAILPPDINDSRVRWWGKDRQTRVGFMQIKGLTAKAMERILVERDRGGPYTGFDDFLLRAALDPSDIKALIKAGAFDALEGREKRTGMLWMMTLMENGMMEKWKNGKIKCTTETQRTQRNINQKGWHASGALSSDEACHTTISLFNTRPSGLPSMPPYDERTLLRQEQESFGFLISRHPLELYADRLKGLNLVSSRDLDKHIGKRVQVVGWLLTGKIVSTKKKELMEFLTFEDLDGLIETVFFPKVYDRYCHMLTRTRPYLLRGKVEEDHGAVTLTVEEVRKCE